MEGHVLEAATSAVEILGRWTRCTVHSAYSSTVNLTADGRELVALVTSDGLLHPYSLRLDLVAFHGVKPGSVCSLGAEWLLVGGVGKIACGAASRADCILPRKGRGEYAQEVVRCLKALCLKKEISSAMWFMVEESAGSALASFKPAIERFGRAALSGNVSVALKAARDLLGLGWGLTPSFDDFAVGFLAALWACRSLTDATYCVLVSELANVAFEKTTPISANFMLHAASGRFAKPVLDVFAALEKVDGSLELATDALLTVGHSSGGDTLTGILYGLTAL